MKTLSKIIIGVIITLIIAALIYALFFTKAEAPQTIHENVTISWVTHTEQTSGISIQTPADFVTAKAPVFMEQNIFSLAVPTTTPYVHTHLLHEALVSINTPAVNCPKVQPDAFGTPSEVKPVSINGVVWNRETTSDVGAGNLYQEVVYTTVRGSKCYRVDLFLHSTNGEAFYTDDADQIAKVDAQQAKDVDALFKLFDQIALTIKFTK